jgi:hypothetical protein
MDRRAADNEYFHKDFHSSVNRGINYVGEKHGKDAVIEYLTRYTENVYNREIADIKSRGVSAIADKILDTYEKEKAPDAVELTLDGDSLEVNVRYCPAIKHLRSIGREISPWFRYTTEVVMNVLAEKANVRFTMIDYNEETGAAKYRFN